MFCHSHLAGFFLSGRGHRTVFGAVRLTVTVAGLAVSAAAARVSLLLLVVPSCVLVFVVQHCLKVHHRPGMPGLRENWYKLVEDVFLRSGYWKQLACLFMMSFSSLLRDSFVLGGCNYTDPNIRVGNNGYGEGSVC